ncbi:hypothetical protein SUDANB15_00051 [Streptomyces sp. enrichment culture]|uniref:hypothetical protein n=1 Tax=Streptomyces sp. enrichment culture TaxID=1795815 RepID=UPI003F55BC10
MPPRQGRRARITFSDAAAKQLDSLTSEAELHALDRTLAVISVDPEIGQPIPSDTTGPQLRQCTDDVDQVRVLVLRHRPAHPGYLGFAGC